MILLSQQQSLREVHYLLPEEDPASAIWSKAHHSAMLGWIITSPLDKMILRNVSRLDLLLLSSNMGHLFWQQILPTMDSLRDLIMSAVECCSVEG